MLDPWVNYLLCLVLFLHQRVCETGLVALKVLTALYQDNGISNFKACMTSPPPNYALFHLVI